MMNRPKTRKISLAIAQVNYNQGDQGRFIIKMISYQVANQCGTEGIPVFLYAICIQASRTILNLYLRVHLFYKDKYLLMHTIGKHIDHINTCLLN